LRKALTLPPVAIALVQEAKHAGAAEDLAMLVKALPLTARGMAGLARAISSAGGIAWEELDARFMLRRHPGLFAAGEMLDWEAPTGGYLLQACFATGIAAAEGLLAGLSRDASPKPETAAPT
jgi:predicted flavoprotein YhiN